MEPLFLPEVEGAEGDGPHAAAIAEMRKAGLPVPQILHLFTYKSDRTGFLARFTHGVMRGPSPLSPGKRELIAAFVSSRNQCPF